MKYGRSGYLLVECPRDIICSVLKLINNERLQLVCILLLYISKYLCTVFQFLQHSINPESQLYFSYI